MRNVIQFLTVLIFAFVANQVVAQIQYTRSYDKTGINVFEPSKMDENVYEGFKIRIGGSFTQDFQSFNVENKANYVSIGADKPKTNKTYSAINL
ncbi:MAG: hypothetical protein IPI53_13325 [Saprospiraceae bacterium]|nr:hypothetical protein [Saprospiraceae bacterium]